MTLDHGRKPPNLVGLARPSPAGSNQGVDPSQPASEEVIVRAIADDDWQAILRIDRGRYGEDSWSKYLVRMAPILFGKLSCIAEVDGVPVGYCLVAPQDHQIIWILALVVQERVEGRGIGRGLMARALAEAAGAGYREARLTVAPDNEPALALYDRLGFRQIGRDPTFFGPGEPRILLSLAVTSPG